MSLFGGDSAPDSSAPASAADTSDFSITPIGSPLHPTQPSDQAFLSPPGDQSNESDGAYRPSASESEYDDDHEHEHLEDERPNRFRGPQRAWRHYTRDERRLVASLDQIRASDLSIHLYNAHALKARLRRQDAATASRPWNKKNSWVAQDEDGQKPWYPDRLWTAWPLEPDAVPIPSLSVHGAGHGEQTYKMEEQQRPSRDLEAELQATMLRTAKEHWRARRLSTSSEEDIKQVVERRARTRSKSIGPAASVTSPGSLDQPPPKSDGPAPDTDNEAQSGLDNDVTGPRPVFSVDARSERLLQPTVRHLLSRIDSLLLALHRNRSGHYEQWTDDQSNSDSSKSAARSRSGSRSRSTRHSRTPVPRKGRRLRQTAAEVQPDASDENQGTTSRPDTGRLERSDVPIIDCPPLLSDKPFRAGTRDWSEVLGLAALTGWDAATVDRAASRCSALFNESMSFRSHSELVAADSRVTNSVLLTTTERGYSCPYELCPRHFKPFSQGYRFHEHLRRSHKLTADEITQLEQALQIDGSITTASNRDWQPPHPLQCPFPNCTLADKVFPATHRFLEHMRRAHHCDPRTQPIPPPRTSPERRSTDWSLDSVDDDYDDNISMESGDDMVGGVHNDGFLRPIGSYIERRQRKRQKRTQSGHFVAAGGEDQDEEAI